MEAGIGCLLGAVVFVLGIPLRALAISLTWTWFVSPVFNVPAVSVLQAVGISMFIGVLIAPLTDYNGWRQSKENKETAFGELIVWAFSNAAINPLLAIGFAWLWHVFIQGGHPWLSSQAWLN
jgi:hypothetical protein